MGMRLCKHVCVCVYARGELFSMCARVYHHPEELAKKWADIIVLITYRYVIYVYIAVSFKFDIIHTYNMLLIFGGCDVCM